METQDSTTTDVLPAIDQAEAGVQPTSSVKNFWERLDDVFIQNNELRRNMEELVENFPEFEKSKKMGVSSVFQPDRIVINSKDKLVEVLSNQDFQLANSVTANQSYTTMRIKLQKALLNVKSIQLLSAIVPVPQTSIPATERFFMIYKMRNIINSSTGAWNGAVNYNRYDIVTDTGNYYYLNRDWNLPINAWNANNPYNIQDIVTYLGNYYYCNYANKNVVPTSGQPIPQTSDLIWIQVPNPVTISPSNNPFFWNLIGAVGAEDDGPNYLDLADPTNNLHYISFPMLDISPPQNYEAINQNTIPYLRIFADYDDLVNNLNLASTGPVVNITDIPNELTFAFNATYNRIQVSVTDPNSQFYYLPVGGDDYNLHVTANPINPQEPYIIAYPPQYLPMNGRLGFTWNGFIPGFNQGQWAVSVNPFNNASVYVTLVDYIFPFIILPRNPFQIYTSFNNIPDMNYAPALQVYCDFTQGSTQDSAGNGNLLSIIPLNTPQFGVAYYQNNFNNPLTKIPSIITEINIRLLTDKGLPYYLPNQATVLFELAVDYN